MSGTARPEAETAISVVTPTLRRPREVTELLANLEEQTLLPRELVLVDGAPEDERVTEERVRAEAGRLPYRCRYVRHGGGTAIQRNVGLDVAEGDLIAFVDDDVRLESDFFAVADRVFRDDAERAIGGVVGYRTNRHFPLESQRRWRWYRRLRLLSTYEPGRYDFRTGYPINANMQPPFSGLREVDFMTTACAVWRREVFDSGLRFDPFFSGYGVLEDAHLSLRAGRRWRLVQSGDARCRELTSPGGRENRRLIGYKCVVNYYYVYRDVAGPLSLGQKLRFWRFQAFDAVRLLDSALRRWQRKDLQELGGKLQGAWAVFTGAAFPDDR